MQFNKQRPKRRWGAAILAWIGAYALLVITAQLYTNIKYELLSSNLGAEIRPLIVVAPWWANVIFFIICIFIGKKFLFPDREKEDE